MKQNLWRINVLGFSFPGIHGAFYETMARYGVETNNRLLMSYEEIFS